ncbi:MAG: LysM domain-containing protein [Rhodospirillaceae bacterium]
MPNSRKTIVLFIVAVVFTVSLVTLVVQHIGSLEATISTLSSNNMRLEKSLENSEQVNSDLLSEVENLNDQLAELLQPKLVSGPARFPISRVLARQGDTVSKLAQREGTSSAVIQALNPWLDGKTDLIASQAIWIPNPEP